MTDQLYKGRLKGLDVAFTYAVTTQAVNESVVRHDCDPAAAHILGRAMTGAVLASALLPAEQRVNICWRYKGSLKTIVVDAGQNGTVRSFISPAQLTGLDDVHDTLYGEVGELQLIVSQEKDGSILSSGTTPISLHDAVNDLAYHYCISDQIETGMSAMIGFSSDPKAPVTLCQGLMLQALPNTDLERLDRMRRRLDDDVFRDLLSQAGEGHEFIESLAAALIADEEGYEGLEIETCPSPEFKCTCNRTKMAAVMRSLPVPERMELVKAKENIGVRCQFCNERYELTIDECIVAWNTK